MVTMKTKPLIILMADDDEDDRLLADDALKEARVVNAIKFVNDGEELMRYLRREGDFDEENAPRPGLILLDLNMPKKDGRQALQEIKADATLRRIPVVILTTSREEEDLVRSYDLGAASYISKPVTFDRMVELMKSLNRYWVEFVEVPDA